MPTLAAVTRSRSVFVTPSTDTVTSASPGYMPVTVPVADTDAVFVAPAGFTTLQVMTRSARSPASVPSADLGLATSASGAAARTVGAGSGLTTTLVTRRITRTVAVANRPPAVAVTRTDPTATAFAAPVVGSIVRMLGLSVDHRILANGMLFPWPSSADATNVRISPSRNTGVDPSVTGDPGTEMIGPLPD